MSKVIASFRVGKVRGYRRGKVWYLHYYENGRRHRPRVGPQREAAQRMAAAINGQLAVGTPAALSFAPVSIPDLRSRWLEHHEYVRRSSPSSIRRSRSATEHLLNFVRDVCPVRHAAEFQPRHAERFVRYLRSLQVTRNGRPTNPKRPLFDSGVKYILGACSWLFNFAQRQRHLSPYAENPFRTIEVQRIPIQNSKPIVVFTPEREQAFLEACDDWQFPVFLTMLTTGLRPGELGHLLLPDDVDLEAGWLHVRNKMVLGWQVKTRNERSIPLMPEVVDVLRFVIGRRSTGPLFRRKHFVDRDDTPFVSASAERLANQLRTRIREEEALRGGSLTRDEQGRMADSLWRDLGSLALGNTRKQFVAVTKAIGRPQITAPKTLRHTFATMLQEGNVDPLIRNELMGHVPAGASRLSPGLGMTAVYTHTRPETKREQLQNALKRRSALEVANRWLAQRQDGLPPEAVDNQSQATLPAKDDA